MRAKHQQEWHDEGCSRLARRGARARSLVRDHRHRITGIGWPGTGWPGIGWPGTEWHGV